MKKFISLFFVLLFFNSYSQSSNVKYIAIKSKSSLLYDKFNGSSCYTTGEYNTKYSDGDLLFVSGIFDCKSYSSEKQFAKVYFDSKPYFIEITTDDVIFIDGDKKSVNEADIFLKSLNIEQENEFVNNAELESKKYIEYLKVKYGDEVFKNQNSGIGILEAHPVEQYSFTGAKFKILNFSKKKLKYITFNFYGKNAVNDKVGNSVSRKGIGPVESLSIGSWEFDSVWLTDVIDSMKLTSVLIQYFDGTSKTIQITSDHWVDDDSLYRLEKLYN